MTPGDKKSIYSMKKYGWTKTGEVRNSNFVEYTSPLGYFKAIRNEGGEWHLYTVPANYQDVPEYMNTYDTLEGCTMGAQYSVCTQAETNEELELAEKEAYKTKDIIEAHEKNIAHCDEKIRRELRELQANTKWLEDERERLLDTLDYLQRQVVLMA